MAVNSITKSTDGRYSYSISDKTGKRYFLKSRKDELKKDFVIRCEELDKKIRGSIGATLKEVIDFYIKNSAAGTSRKHTVVSSLKIFSVLYNTDFRNIKRQNLIELIKTKKYSKSYAKTVIGAFSAVCNFYCDYYDLPKIQITKNVIKYFDFSSGHPHKEISKEDYHKILDYLKDKSIESYKFCIVLYETGLRPSELAAGNHYDDKFIYIEKGLTNYGYSEGKTFNAKRKVPLSKTAFENLTVFNNSTVRRTRTLLQKTAKTIGVKATLYDFRHTFASRMARKGVNIRALQQVMGHATPEFTLKFYVKASDDDLLNILN